jgi:hypothetical protein
LGGDVMSFASPMKTRPGGSFIAPDAVVILEVFSKKTQQTPQHVISTCKERLKLYDQLSRG